MVESPIVIVSILLLPNLSPTFCVFISLYCFFFYFTVHLSSCIEREILLVLLNKNKKKNA